MTINPLARPVLAAFVVLLCAACTGTAEQVETSQPTTNLPTTGQPITSEGTGEALYAANCAACHDQAFYKAPTRMFIGALGPKNLLRVMNEGSMMGQAANIDPAGRVAIAEYLSGKRLADLVEPPLPPACTTDQAFDPTLTPVSRGWGVDLANSRFHPANTGGLTADNVASLEVKWAFAYPNAFQARSQPIYGGGAIYVGSQDGTVWALGAQTGCLHWRFQATAEVRTGMVVTPWLEDDSDPNPSLFFGDTLANVYAVSARTGKLLWKVKADDHSFATLTGTPTFSNGRVYVPVSSLEVVAASNPAYECCTFRGAVLALDAHSGEQLWKSYTTDTAPAAAGKTSAGTTIMAPSGAPIWSAPTIDEQRGRLYIATGENYSSPADGNSDAIIALDLETGKKLWVSQQTARDAWNTACFTGFPGINNANCPAENGPDYDFGSHTILVELPGGSAVVVGGQKSGDAVGVNADTGETLWKTRVGRGGLQGGVHFGIAAEGDTVYVPINDRYFRDDDIRYQYKMEAQPGVYAVHAETGELLWSAPSPDVCGDLEYCSRGVSQAITASTLR